MSVRGSIAWSLLGNWVNFGTTLIATVILARLLTPAQFGVFAVAMATIGIFQAVLQVGTGSLLIRAPELDDTMIGSACSVALLEGLAISLLVVLASYFADTWQNSAEVSRLLILLVPVPVFAAMENVLVGVWWRNLQFDRSAKLQAAKSAVQAVAAIMCGFAGMGAASLAVGALLSGAMGFAAATFGLAQRGIRPNVAHLRVFAVFGGKWMVLGGLRAISARAPELLLGRLSGLAATGLYNRASSSLDMVVRNGVEPIARVMLPLLGQSHRRGTGLAAGIVKLSSNITTIFWPLLGFIALEAQPAILVLFGPSWIEASPVLAVLCGWVALTLPTSGTGEALLILDRLGISVRIETVRAVVGIMLIIVAAPFGLTAVAGARVVEAALFMPVYVLVMRRLTQLPVRAWASAHARSICVTVATLSPVVAVRLSVLVSPAPLVRIVIEGSLAAIAFSCAMVVLRHPLVDDARSMLRDRLGRPAREALNPGGVDGA